MVTLDELLARRAALEEARASGLSSLRVGGTHMMFKTDAEMAAALGELDRQIRERQSGRQVAFVRCATSKGL